MQVPQVPVGPERKNLCRINSLESMINLQYTLCCSNQTPTTLRFDHQAEQCIIVYVSVRTFVVAY
jgi:hypothetical protein